MPLPIASVHSFQKGTYDPDNDRHMQIVTAELLPKGIVKLSQLTTFVCALPLQLTAVATRTGFAISRKRRIVRAGACSLLGRCNCSLRFYMLLVAECRTSVTHALQCIDLVYTRDDILEASEPRERQSF